MLKENIKVKVVINDRGYYELEGCPLYFKQPLCCQTIGCTCWNGYVFEDVYSYMDGETNSIKRIDYESSQWRKIDSKSNVIIADYVRCTYKGENDIIE